MSASSRYLTRRSTAEARIALLVEDFYRKLGANLPYLFRDRFLTSKLALFLYEVVH